jgi:hypothetical protein
MLRLFVLSLCLAVQGCTYQAWYIGFQERQRQQCYKNTVNAVEAQQCLDRVNNTTYDQYNRYSFPRKKYFLLKTESRRSGH